MTLSEEEEEMYRTQKIIRQYIYCRIKRNVTEKVEKEVQCLLDLSDDILHTYKLVFTQIIQTILSADPAYWSGASDKFLQEETLNWGRFASLYVLAGELAIDYEQKGDIKMVESIIYWLQIATVKKVFWITNIGGGWAGFLKLLDKTQLLKLFETTGQQQQQRKQRKQRRAFTYFVFISVTAVVTFSSLLLLYVQFM